ncbi:MAG: hypothetical protein WAM30_12945, partial [Candidatus Dormiibacterota bacterium]
AVHHLRTRRSRTWAGAGARPAPWRGVRAVPGDSRPSRIASTGSNIEHLFCPLGTRRRVVTRGEA